MVGELADNLFAPNSLDRVGPEAEKPIDLMRLDSSAALVHNVFDYWTGRDCQPIASACGMDAAEPMLKFSELLPVAAAINEDMAPPIDVMLTSSDAKPIAIVATLGEPYQLRKRGGTHGLESLTQSGLWGPLQDCRALAVDHSASSRHYGRLQVSGLLKQCLALSNCYGPRGFRLLYLWFEVPGHASQELSREIDGFRMRVGGEVDFASCSWQTFFERFRPNCSEHLGYAAFLGSRYFEP